MEPTDLRRDLGERDDLTARKPEKATQLAAMLAAWRQPVDARMPRPNPEYR